MPTKSLSFVLFATLLSIFPSSDAFTQSQLMSLAKPRRGLQICTMAAAEPQVLPFTQEMRQKAMSLHTFSQAPKEGPLKDNSANTQVEQWQTTKEDYLQFLVDSKVVYQAFEKSTERPELQSLRNTGLRGLISVYFHMNLLIAEVSLIIKSGLTGLERVQPLTEDIAYITSK